MTENGEIKGAQGNIFEQENPFSAGIETLAQVAAALNLTTETIRTHARHAAGWKGQLFRRDTKKDELITDDDFFFPAGTIERNKDNFGRRKKTPPHFTKNLMKAMDELKAENEELKKQSCAENLRLDWLENRVKTGGLLPAEEEEGECF